jgi:hypothetical protein
MSGVVFPTDEVIMTGDLVYLEEKTCKATLHVNPGKLLGVAIRSPTGKFPNGRNWFAINGVPYYTKDAYIWDEDLAGDACAEISSCDYCLNGGSNVTIITHGIAAVKKTVKHGDIPMNWIKIHEGDEFINYLLK